MVLAYLLPARFVLSFLYYTFFQGHDVATVSINSKILRFWHNSNVLSIDFKGSNNSENVHSQFYVHVYFLISPLCLILNLFIKYDWQN